MNVQSITKKTRTPCFSTLHFSRISPEPLKLQKIYFQMAIEIAIAIFAIGLSNALAHQWYDTKEVMLILYSFTPTRDLWYEFSNNLDSQRDFCQNFCQKKAGLGKHSNLKYALGTILIVQFSSTIFLSVNVIYHLQHFNQIMKLNEKALIALLTKKA